eukprot:2900065-Rhodomonas_salina.2
MVGVKVAAPALPGAALFHTLHLHLRASGDVGVVLVPRDEPVAGETDDPHVGARIEVLLQLVVAGLLLAAAAGVGASDEAKLAHLLLVLRVVTDLALSAAPSAMVRTPLRATRYVQAVEVRILSLSA